MAEENEFPKVDTNQPMLGGKPWLPSNLLKRMGQWVKGAQETYDKRQFLDQVRAFPEAYPEHSGLEVPETWQDVLDYYGEPGTVIGNPGWLYLVKWSPIVTDPSASKYTFEPGLHSIIVWVTFETNARLLRTQNRPELTQRIPQPPHTSRKVFLRNC